MTPRDFCYWLQGTFELGRIKGFDAEQVHVLHQHLQLVQRAKFDRSRNQDALVGADFCNWLSGVLDEVGTDKEMSPDVVAKIGKRLSATFLHVIDDTFDNRHELLEIHRQEAESAPAATRPRVEAMC